MANSYDQYQSVRCTVVIQDVDSGAYVDPTTLTFSTYNPFGTTTDYVYGVDPEVVKDSVGHYHCDVTLDEPGDWYYQWRGTGTNIGACQCRMCARESKF